MEKGGRFGNGFMLGVIVGGLIVFLWGTATGKKILKIISEEGLEGLGNLLEEYGIDEDILENEEGEETEEAEGQEGLSDGESVSEPQTSPKHRFFKRIRK